MPCKYKYYKNLIFSREAAFDLLVTAAESLLRWEPDNKDEALRY